MHIFSVLWIISIAYIFMLRILLEETIEWISLQHTQYSLLPFVPLRIHRHFYLARFEEYFSHVLNIWQVPAFEMEPHTQPTPAFRD